MGLSRGKDGMRSRSQKRKQCSSSGTKVADRRKSPGGKTETGDVSSSSRDAPRLHPGARTRVRHARLCREQRRHRGVSDVHRALPAKSIFQVAVLEPAMLAVKDRRTGHGIDVSQLGVPRRSRKRRLLFASRITMVWHLCRQTMTMSGGARRKPRECSCMWRDESQDEDGARL